MLDPLINDMLNDPLRWMILALVFWMVFYAIWDRLFRGHAYQERMRKERCKDLARDILLWTESGKTTGRELQLSEILCMGVNPGFNNMGSIYHSYIHSLGLQKRVEIVDKILDCQRRRLPAEGTPSMVDLLEKMNDTETETVIMAVCPNNVVDWVDMRSRGYDASALANDIIAFRLQNPY